MQRLRIRESERFGTRVEVGGDRFELSKAFLEWASLYDAAGLEVRSRKLHERWIKRLPCPILRVQSLMPPEKLASETLHRITKCRSNLR
jgi:hypothetical protein